MVLPPSAPHDAHGSGDASWLERLKLSLRLSRAGLLVLVDQARPQMLGELVRALLPEHPELEVHTEVSRVLEVPHGSTLVLAPRATDATWLNLNRPVFSYRELKVILWCDAETTLALARQAVDFFDWISHRVECPHRPPTYAVEGIRRALAARVPGIVWLGGDLEACFAAARPRGVLHRISAARPYAELVAEVKAHARAWLVWENVEDASRLRRVRWALAEAGHRTRAILAEPAVSSPGWRRVHARAGDLWSARERLEREGARFPGRLGALANLEPEAVDLLEALLRQGGDERAIEEALLGPADPGAVLGGLTLERGAVPAQALIRDHAPIPVLRAASRNGLRPRREDLEQVKWAELEDVAWWAAWSTRLPSTVHLMKLVPVIRAYVAEPLLRSCQLTANDWNLLAEVTLDAGEAPVASLWSRRALEMAQAEEGEFLRASYNLARTLEAQGEYQEAESLLRRTLPLMEKALGVEHPTYGASMHALAGVLSHQGKYEEAEGLLRRALAIGEKALGADHPSLSPTLANLGGVLTNQNRPAEGLPFVERALQIATTTHGRNHPDVAQILFILARLQDDTRHPGAPRTAREALEMLERTLGR